MRNTEDMRRRRRTRPLVLAVAVAALSLAPAASAAATAPRPEAAHPGTAAGAAGTEPGHPTVPTTADPQQCDPIDPADCLLPFPNDWFSRPDASSTTGRRVDIPVTAMPRNAASKPIEPTEYDDLDGFGVGSTITTRVPGLEATSGVAPNRHFTALAASGIAQITDMADSLGPDDGLVLLDMATGQRQLVWAEVDESGDLTSDAQRLLLIHPGAVLHHGHRYVVALAHLRRADGTPIAAQPAFAAYRDGTAPTSDPRVPHMEELFGDLAAAGVARGSVYLAWDFTTASTADTTGRLTAIRDDAFGQLGDHDLTDGVVQGSSPAVTVKTATPVTAAAGAFTEVTGTVTVPCYITPTCTEAGQFAPPATDPDATPTQTPGQTAAASWVCEIPQAALAVGGPSLRPSLYGHGLFGSPGEAGADNVRRMAAEHGMLECGVEWYGMATADVPAALVALNDLSRFPELVDRVQQGVLNFLFVGRALVHPQGFCAQAAFTRPDGTCVIDRTKLFYDGNSQGGIYGGTVVAVSPDLDRGVLGVLGMEYSTLLPRSADYVAQCPVTSSDPSNPAGCVGYSTAFDASYPDPSKRFLILNLIQSLWDRADPAGYAEHMTDGALGTPPHHVLLQMAWGDHQVANITAESEARTIGAHLVAPALEPGRATYDHFVGIPAITSYPYDGSALAVYDSGPVGATARGTEQAPLEDVPNRVGTDPHEAPRATVCGRAQKSAFLQVGGAVRLPCPAPLYSYDYAGAAPTAGLPEAPAAALLLLPAGAAALALGVRRHGRRG